MKRAKGWRGLAVAVGLSLGFVAAAWADSEVVGGVTWSYSLAGGNATVKGADPAEGKLYIPSSLGNCPVTSIGKNAFDDCRYLTSVTIPDIVTSIGDRAFDGCSGLTNVTIPRSVTNIGEYAFSGCSGLTSVTIPDSVTRIGSGAFSSCSGLRSVTIPDSVMWIGHSTFANCGLTNVTIPDSVRSIEDYAFSGCADLASVRIPDSVTSIGGSAFSGCSGLTSVTIGNGVTSVEWDTFLGCSGLTSVTIGKRVTSIGEGAFLYCSGLTNVTIPDSVRRIDISAFCGCSGLTSVTIPDSVTSIGESAFSGCNGLKVLYVPTGWDARTILSDAKVPSDCAIVAYDTTGEAKTTKSPVAVPQVWLAKEAGEILAGTEGCCDFEAAAKAAAANGMRVWECYLAGLSPTDAAAEFKVKSFSVKEGGEVVVEWEPDLRETAEDRSYVVEGAATLGGAWGVTNAASRFFRVRVGMQEAAAQGVTASEK